MSCTLKQILALKTYISRFVSVLIVFVCFGSVCAAASFDCDKAVTATEKAICNDPYLQGLDEILTGIYFLKASIDLPEIVFEGVDQTNQQGKFSKYDTKKEQLDWINNQRANCFDDSVCLASSYLDRISSFYNELSNNIYDDWTIAHTLVLEEKSTRVTIWIMDPNSYESSDYSSYRRPFRTIYYLVTVHDVSSGKLISYNPNLIAPVEVMGWTGKEIELVKIDENSFKIISNEMKTAYLHTTSYHFRSSENQVNLLKYKYTNVDRRSHEDEIRMLDLEKKRVELEYEGEKSVRKLDLVSLSLSEATASKIESILFGNE